MTLSLNDLSGSEEYSDAQISGDVDNSEESDDDIDKSEPEDTVRIPDSVEALSPSEDAPPVAVKTNPDVHGDRIRVNIRGHLRDLLNDSNKYQYRYAEKLGIQPIRTLSQAYNTRRPLVKVTSNKSYHVDSLTHSLPFLVPEAEALLRKIGDNFIDSLKRRGINGYRIIATSLLRTPSSVKKLRRVNVNATDSSTHQFATTFDLSYTRYMREPESKVINTEDLKNLLGLVLLDLRNDNRCLVKFERKTGCYHVTVTR